MSTTQKLDVANIPVNFQRSDIETMVRGPRMAEGWYKFQVTGAKGEVSAKTGSMMYCLDVIALDAEGNPRGKSVRHYVVLPIATPRPLLTAAGFPESFKHTPPNTRRLVLAYLQATRPNEYPDNLQFIKNTDGPGGIWLKDGVEISKEEAEAIKMETATKIFNLVTSAWPTAEDTEKAANTFVGDTFYGKLYFQEGRAFPSIGNVAATLPDGEVAVEI